MASILEKKNNVCVEEIMINMLLSIWMVLKNGGLVVDVFADNRKKIINEHTTKNYSSYNRK